MIRHLGAIIWLRWRLLANTVHGGRRRDKLEQISRAFAMVVPLVVVALSMGSVIAIGVVGFLGGRAMATMLVEPALVVNFLRMALLLLAVLVVVLAVTSPAQSALAKYTRLLLLPIHRRVLHLVEVLANLADPWLLFAAAGLLALAAGIVAGGRPGLALVVVAYMALLLLLLASLGAFVSFLIGSLLRSRRRGEMFTLVFVLAISVVGLLPLAFVNNRAGDSDEAREARRAARRDAARQGRTRNPLAPENFDRNLPAWLNVLPTEIGGRAVLFAARGERSAAAVGLTLVAAQTALCFAASGFAHRRMIDSLESDSSRRRGLVSVRPTMPIPFISPAASAVAWVQMRTALRSVRGRVAVLLPGPMLALTAFVIRGQRNSGFVGEIAAQGHLLAGAGMVFGLYAIQAFSMNMFGSDRAGLTLQFLSPLRDREIAWGKVAGCGLIFAVAAGISLIAAFAVNPTGSLFYWIAMVPAGAATYLLLSPFCLWMSALFPVAADLSKTGSGGNPHPLPMFAGTIAVLVLGVPPALVLMGTASWFDRPILAPVLMMGWLVVAVMVAIPGVRLASRAIGARRENLLLTAQGK